MSYVSDNLLPDEKVIARAKLHWGVFVGPALVGAVGIALAFCFLVSAASAPPATAANPNTDPAQGAATMFICCVLPILGLAGLYGVAVAMSYFSTEFAVTNKRIIAKTGMIRQQTLELVLSKVESVAVKQGLMGSLLGYGTVVVSGSGGTHQGFPNIAEPGVIRQKINAIIAKLSG